jgi:hypothetical protein
MASDPTVQERRDQLVQEAQITLDSIRALADPGVLDPLTAPVTLARAVTTGILDAPHLRNNAFARGKVTTRIDHRGASVTMDPASGEELLEQERMALLNQIGVE